jgi:hypothetical protein
MLVGRTTLCAAFVLVSAGISQAQITGEIWENDLSKNADAVPVGTPNMTFTSTAINWNSSDDSTISGFMNYGGTVTTFANLFAGGDPSQSINNTHVEFTGQVYLGVGVNNFQIGHDDGVRIAVAGIGTVLDDSGPTAFVLSPFVITAPTAGDYTFTVDYNECDGPPATLEWAFPSGAPLTGTVPDGGTTMGLLGISLGALGALARRVRK